MRGKIVGPELRESTRRIWAESVVPSLMAAEISPLKSFMNRPHGIVALDVGANKGYWAKGLLRCFGDAVSHIYMVEPSPENCAELRRRDDNLMFDFADFPKLSVHGIAMSSTVGQANLYTNEDGSPLASLYPHLLNGYDGGELSQISLSETLEVSLSTVDIFLEGLGSPHIDIMKLDVEGHEMDVLLGAQRTLSHQGIDIVSFEFGMHQVDSRHFFKDFYAFFLDYGFDLFFLRESGIEQVQRYACRYEDFSTNFQVAAVRRRAPVSVPFRLSQGKGLPSVEDKAAHAVVRACSAALEACKQQNRELQEELRNTIDAYRFSRSWRLTAPLRSASMLVTRMISLLGRS